MYMTYATTYLQGVGHFGVVVKQGLRWEGVGTNDIWRITKMGNVLGGSTLLADWKRCAQVMHYIPN
jgi:hypothetical protein